MCVFFNDTATTEIYTLSLHDARPIFDGTLGREFDDAVGHGLDKLVVVAGKEDVALELREVVVKGLNAFEVEVVGGRVENRSEEHTSELQSRQYLVCRLLLENKKSLINPLPTPHIQVTYVFVPSSSSHNSFIAPYPPISYC